MALGGYYEAGIVTVTQGQTGVTVSGGTWNGPPGEVIYEGDTLHAFVGSRFENMDFGADAGANSGVLKKAWPYVSGSGVTYFIKKASWKRYDPALTMDQVRQLIAQMTPVTNSYDFASGNKIITLNKGAAGNAAKFLFQDNGVNVAQLGLLNDDILRAQLWDGTAWLDVTGTLFRERLTGNRTYYVRTDGSGSNSGLANNAAGALLTAQQAYNLIAANLDLNGFTVTVQLGDGTYTEGANIGIPWIGGGTIIFQGNMGARDNVFINKASGNAFSATASYLPGYVHIQGMRLKAPSACIYNVASGVMRFKEISFDATSFVHIQADYNGAVIESNGTYWIIGSMGFGHVLANRRGVVSLRNVVIITHDLTVGVAYAYCTRQSFIDFETAAFSWGVTGGRYSVDMNSVIYTGGAGENYLPGTTPGNKGTGGQYI